MSFIPKTSKKVILKRLEDREYEDLELLADLEKHILKRRDYIISPLKEGENVILLLSGGLDSIVLWKLLLSQFKIHVYPFYLSQNFNLAERLSIEYYKRQFQNEAGYHAPRFQRTRSKFKYKTRVVNLLPELALKCFAPKIGEVLQPNSGMNFLSVLYAAYYRMQLWWDYELKINKIISGITAEDGYEIYTQTHTFSRQLMLILISMLADNSMEYFAFGLEKELSHFLTKSNYINLGKSLGLDVSKTHSCYRSTIFNCGVCKECLRRQSLFKKNNLEDKTFYLQSYFRRWLDLTSFGKNCIVKLQKLVRRLYEKVC